MIIVALSMAAATLTLGFSVGAMVGLSQTPVVAVALPLVFSVASGAGGFYLFKIDFASANGRKAIVLASLAIVGMCTGTLLGLALGIEKRTRQAPAWKTVVATERGTAPLELVERLVLDARLHLLGLQQDTRRALVQRIGDADVGWSVDAVGDAVGEMASSLERVLPSPDVVSNRSEWVSVVEQLETLEELLASGLFSLDGPALAKVLETISGDLYLLGDDDDDMAYLAQGTEARSEVDSLAVRLAFFVEGLKSGQVPSRAANRILDDFMSTGEGEGSWGELGTVWDLAESARGFPNEG